MQEQYFVFQHFMRNFAAQNYIITAIPRAEKPKIGGLPKAVTDLADATLQTGEDIDKLNTI